MQCKTDCKLTDINSNLEPIGQAEGLINGMVSVTGSVDELKRWFELGQDNDIKNKIELETGAADLIR